MTLMTIADTPHSIAFGSAIGIFFGFSPLYPLKTLLSIVVAWMFRCNKVAAAIAVTLHDVLIWVMPAIYLGEYQFGCWILNRPAAQRVHFRQFRLHDYVHWHVFSRRYLAHLLARVYWFALPFHSFCDHCLFSDAVAHQPRQSNADDSMKIGRCCFEQGLSGVGPPSGRSM